MFWRPPKKWGRAGATRHPRRGANGGLRMRSTRPTRSIIPARRSPSAGRCRRANPPDRAPPRRTGESWRTANRRYLREPVLDRVKVDVIHVSGIIAIVADRVLPIAALPNPALALVRPAAVPGIGQRLREARLDPPPSIGEVAVTLRKGPQAMHVVRQHDPPVDAKRQLPSNLAHHLAQRVYVRQEQPGAAVVQVDREEIGGARDPVASVVRHRATMPDTSPCVERRAGATRREPRETNGGLRCASPAYEQRFWAELHLPKTWIIRFSWAR